MHCISLQQFQKWQKYIFYERVAEGKAFNPHDLTPNDVNLTRFCHPFSVSAKPPTISENWKDNDELVQKPVVKCQSTMGKLAIMNLIK